jgi:hypothetical protein
VEISVDLIRLAQERPSLVPPNAGSVGHPEGWMPYPPATKAATA